MINLAVADIIIIVFGYPVVVAANVSSGLLIHSTCVWSGFVNGAVGIASIANLTMMSLVMYSSFQSLNCTTKIPGTKMAAMIAFTWLYGILAMFPPLVGWNEFVPGASGISCCPNWVPETKAGVAYNALLVFVGFVLPLSVIIYCYYRIYRQVIFLEEGRELCLNKIKVTDKTRKEQRIFFYIGERALFVHSSPYRKMFQFGTPGENTKSSSYA